MDEKELFHLLKKKGAILEGHFLLSSGLHSPTYLQCAKLLQYPKLTKKLCRELAGRFNGDTIDVVFAPAIGGIIVGYEVAGALNARAIFSERVEGKMVLRRGFKIHKGENVLVIEDVVTTGGSVKEIIQLIEKKCAQIRGVGMIVDRSGGKVDFGVKKIALLTLNIENYPKQSCPLCKKEIPLTYLGTRYNGDRKHYFSF